MNYWTNQAWHAPRSGWKDAKVGKTVERICVVDADYKAVDAKEEIVRCRNCKHRFGCVHLLEDSDGDMRRCDVSPECFCSWGERDDE